MLDVLLIIIFFASLTCILYIVLSKFPQLASIRLEIIPSEQQWTIRNRIIANRLKGKVGDKKALILKTIRPFWLNFTSLFWKIYGRVLAKEKQLQHLAMSNEERETAKSKISQLLRDAKEANKENKFMRAERQYIEVISLDPQNLDAYDGLAKMYWQQKDYQKVGETLKFLLNLAKRIRKKRLNADKDTAEIDARLVRYYLDFGELSQYRGKNEEALQSFSEAIKLDENNHKALDQLLEISIILKKIDFAKELIEKIKKTNFDNQKIVYWEDRMREFEE